MALCGNISFWDQDLTWNTDLPIFSRCFRRAIFTMFPMAVFWLILPFYVRYLLKNEVATRDNSHITSSLKILIIKNWQQPVIYDWKTFVCGEGVSPKITFNYKGGIEFYKSIEAICEWYSSRKLSVLSAVKYLLAGFLCLIAILDLIWWAMDSDFIILDLIESSLRAVTFAVIVVLVRVSNNKIQFWS